MPPYLKLPLRFEKFFQNGTLDTCSLEQSIARNIHLLITTGLGENSQDPEYGSSFWDYDYDIHIGNEDRREAILQSLREQIFRYEKRLEEVEIEVNVRQAQLPAQSGGQLRHRIEIIVTGSLVRNKEPFVFKTGFFIGPLLLD